MATTSTSELVERLIRDDVRAVSAYHVPDFAGLIKLDAMENPYQWPDELRDALQACAADAAINRYPDPRSPGVIDALAEAFDIDPRWRILLGNGSDELIQMLIQAVSRPGASVLAPAPTFVMYRVIAGFLNVGYHEVDLRPDFSLDIDAMLEVIGREQPELVFLACPNNPSGNLFARDDLRRIIEASEGLVVIDEAYSPFASDQHLDLLADYPNVLVMRTLSKLGLAGLRLGYLVGDARWIEQFDKVRLPYNIGVVTQAVTELALRNYHLFKAQTDAICAERAVLLDALRKDSRLNCLPSDANFLVVRLPAGTAAAVHSGMRERGVLIKKLDGMHPLLADCLRITVGSPDENAAMLGALEASLDALAVAANA